MEYENKSYKGSVSQRPRRRKRRKKKAVFKKVFISYLLVLAVCCIAAMIYVRKTLVLYEDSQSNVYMQNFISDLAENTDFVAQIEEQYFSTAALSKFDDVEMCKQKFDEKINSLEFSYELSAQSYDTSLPIYNVYADKEPFITVTLKSVNPETKLGIMTISEWEIENIALRSGQTDASGSLPGLGGKFEYTISAPSNYKVYINDIELTSDEFTGEVEAIEMFLYASEYIKMPELVTYKVDGLVFEPTIKIKDALGNDVEFEIKNNKIKVEPTYKSNTSGKEYESKVDALNIAKTWSKFMTADLSGSSYGVGQVQKYFVKNSYLYNMAYEYATSVDITFVSAHVINSFTNESVTNYIAYTDDCFSCDVYFEKNMTLTKTGDKRTDVFNSRMLFIYINDSNVATPGWYLVDMQAIID